MKEPYNIMVQRPFLIPVTCDGIRGVVNASLIAWVRAARAEDNKRGAVLCLMTGETITADEPMEELLALIAEGR